MGTLLTPMERLHRGCTAVKSRGVLFAIVRSNKASKISLKTAGRDAIVESTLTASHAEQRKFTGRISRSWLITNLVAQIRFRALDWE